MIDYHATVCTICGRRIVSPTVPATCLSSGTYYMASSCWVPTKAKQAKQDSDEPEPEETEP